MKNLLIVMVIACSFASCGDSKSSSQDQAPSYTPPTNVPTYNIINIEDSTQTDFKGTGPWHYITLDVVVKNSNDIDSVNSYLKAKYITSKDVIFHAFYYDDPQVAKTYRKSLDDKSVSDSEMNKMYKHVFKDYSYGPGLPADGIWDTDN